MRISNLHVHFHPAVSRHRQIMNLVDSKPIIGHDVFIAPSASVIGAVTLGTSSSVWYGAVLRGDTGRISLAECAAALDRSVITGEANVGALSRLGNGCVLHDATVAAESVVGAGAVLKRCVLGKNSLVAPGSTLLDARVPDGELWAGSPAVFVRKLTKEEVEGLIEESKKLTVLAPKPPKE